MRRHIHIYLPARKISRLLVRDTGPAPSNAVMELVERLMAAIEARQGAAPTKDADWDESKHPRAQGGQFAKTQGPSGGDYAHHVASANHHLAMMSAKGGGDPDHAYHKIAAEHHQAAAHHLKAGILSSGGVHPMAQKNADWAAQAESKIGSKAGEKLAAAETAHLQPQPDVGLQDHMNALAAIASNPDISPEHKQAAIQALQAAQQPKPGPDGQSMGVHPDMMAAAGSLLSNPSTTPPDVLAKAKAVKKAAMENDNFQWKKQMQAGVGVGVPSPISPELTNPPIKNHEYTGAKTPTKGFAGVALDPVTGMPKGMVSPADKAAIEAAQAKQSTLSEAEALEQDKDAALKVGTPTGAKPTSATAKGAKAATHELLSSGHPFTLEELMKATGVQNKATLLTAIADLKNPKYAGAKGALQIEKHPDGGWHVPGVKPQAAAPAPAPKAAPPQHPGTLQVPAAAPKKAAGPTHTPVQKAYGVTNPGQYTTTRSKDIGHPHILGKGKEVPFRKMDVHYNGEQIGHVESYTGLKNGPKISGKVVAWQKPVVQFRAVLGKGHFTPGAGAGHTGVITGFSSAQDALAAMQRVHTPPNTNSKSKPEPVAAVKPAAPRDEYLDKAIDEAHAKWGHSTASPEQLQKVKDYFQGKKGVDILKLSDHAGISVGMADSLNKARLEYLRNNKPSKPLTSAQKIDKFLKQKWIGPIKK